MERLQAEDREAGVAEPKRLTKRQKDAIAKLRQDAEAKLAELDILFKDRHSAALGDPEQLTELEQHHQTDRRRVKSALESAVAKEKLKSK